MPASGEADGRRWRADALVSPRSFGCVYTEADLQEMMNEVGGKVDFLQFCHMMTKKMKDCDVVAEIKLAFTQLDEDGDLNINRSELRAVLEKLTDGRVRAEEVDEYMLEAEKKRRGRGG
mmetsp:Transcript_23563/g.76759  ORF Transcript_23563/g.76759 Transcript_23563/m.76759 type:complete len:119 (-) Transcript_23563:298-654(-)